MKQVKKLGSSRGTWPRDPQSTVDADSRSKRKRVRAQKEAAALKEAMDGELDEIDRILEENAEALSSYVQHGGE